MSKKSIKCPDTLTVNMLPVNFYKTFDKARLLETYGIGEPDAIIVDIVDGKVVFDRDLDLSGTEDYLSLIDRFIDDLPPIAYGKMYIDALVQQRVNGIATYDLKVFDGERGRTTKDLINDAENLIKSKHIEPALNVLGSPHYFSIAGVNIKGNEGEISVLYSNDFCKYLDPKDFVVTYRMGIYGSVLDLVRREFYDASCWNNVRRQITSKLQAANDVLDDGYKAKVDMFENKRYWSSTVVVENSINEA